MSMTWYGTLTAMRQDGWSVAVHNDHHDGGVFYTFWLLTHHSGLYVRGEGRTDEEAITAAAKEAKRVFAPSP